MNQSSCIMYLQSIVSLPDAVEAIVTAMQYRGRKSKTSMINVCSGEKVSKSFFADIIESYMPISTKVNAMGVKKPALNPLAKDAKEYLHWQPKTFLKEGVRKLLAWHLNEHMRYGLSSNSSHYLNSPITKNSANETGYQFLKRKKCTTL